MELTTNIIKELFNYLSIYFGCVIFLWLYYIKHNILERIRLVKNELIKIPFFVVGFFIIHNWEGIKIIMTNGHSQAPPLKGGERGTPPYNIIMQDFIDPIQNEFIFFIYYFIMLILINICFYQMTLSILDIYDRNYNE